ncbi:MAG: RagB/SusD family nutrient uptake outer membrane protein [Pedobacter sp.]|jgi:hypothetical protein|uniref:RagB/SusD family nutrient uptake outer membrane protein n=1 Tax=Pedobacter sp. TaxID=1411316 RepID=UPI00356522F5
MKNTLTIIIFLVVAALSFNCKKEDEFLDEKPDQSLILPASLEDYEKLLNNTGVFNNGTIPNQGTISSDEFYVTDAVFNSLSSNAGRNLYKWTKDIDEGTSSGDNIWNAAYKQVYYCNIILDGIPKLTIAPSQQAKFNNLKGMALFFRSWAFYHLVQTYGMPYDEITSKTDLGIPLRLTADINLKSTRATVEQCYAQIISDLEISLTLLQERNDHKTLPSGLAALGFLARVNLALRHYDKAFDYADRFLAKNSVLTDYNIFSASRTSSIHTAFIDEDIFNVTINTGLTVANRTTARIDPAFVATYNDNDLRKRLYFRTSNNEIFFKGSYNYMGQHYVGIATDEVYLIRSECFARKGNAIAALGDLNTLLMARWKSGVAYPPIVAQNSQEALAKILVERRKELLFRGLRWTDLRRFNKENGFETTLTRTVNGETYSLPPNDQRYAIPLPVSEIQLSGLEQNKR